MSTHYSFQEVDPAIDVLAVDDALIVYDTSAARTKQISGVQVQDSPFSQATVSSTGTAITNSGVTQITSTTIANFTLTAPVAGRRKFLVNTSTCTGHTVTLASGTLNNAGNTIVTFQAVDARVELVGLSTSRYSLTGSTGILVALS